eukprot:CAMPEP_0168524302 /NCGR_PEP_ID=MMETSP0405-20121227/10562_1 /TAXON_ID=498012 /ORGANISM="Trichosphaerium sp, Strain Am-I-7 wt" /LENGTH=60 /DNA_ID=CAMNT_0008546469 /DNA_START=240 /DNA_END=422 /DNA_ORIENTATION=-
MVITKHGTLMDPRKLKHNTIMTCYMENITTGTRGVSCGIRQTMLKVNYMETTNSGTPRVT